MLTPEQYSVCREQGTEKVRFYFLGGTYQIVMFQKNIF